MNRERKSKAKVIPKKENDESKRRQQKDAFGSSSESEEDSKVQDKRRPRVRVVANTQRDQPKRDAKGKGTQNYADEEEDDFNLTQNAGKSPQEMASQGVFYLLVAHGRHTSIKRADFTKSVMKGAKPTMCKEILQKVQKLLKGVFGIQMYGLNESTHQWNIDLAGAGLGCLMLVSTFYPIKVSKQVISSTTTKYDEAVQSVLFLSLSLMFMSSVDLSIGIKEDLIWGSVKRLGIQSELDVQEQDFTKFLKTEFVKKQYFLAEEANTDGKEGSTLRYTWGPRAFLEYSKANILVKIAKVLKVRPQDFPEQYKMIMESPEGAAARKVFAKFPLPGLGVFPVAEEREEDMDTQPTEISQNNPLAHAHDDLEREIE